MNLPSSCAADANFTGRRAFSFQQAGWTRECDECPDRLSTEVRNMLLWIAVAGASLGFYSLGLAPFESSSGGEQSQRRELGDD
jgi:hypothetical protein